MRWAWLPLLLTGCWVTEAELSEKLGEGDDTGGDEPITVTSIEPRWGTAAGGTDVTIHANPIGEGAIVRFDDVTAAILSIDGDEIVVRTPPGSAGMADVDVQWGAHAGAVTEGFEYFTDGSDSYGAVGTVAWIDFVGLLELGYFDFGTAWVNFTNRSPYGYDAFYGATLDSCASGWTFPGTLVEASDGTQVQLTRESGSGLTLTWDATEEDYYAEVVAEGTGGNSWISNGVLDLDAIVGVTSFPAIQTKGFVRTPSVFSVQTDCDLCGSPSDLDAIPGPTVYQDDFQVLWDSANPGDYVLIRVDLYGDDESSTPTETVRCLAHDDGAFTIPPTVWTTSPGFSAIDLWVGRARASTALLPHDSSRSGVAGVYWIVGTGALYPM